jgi:hypothetical protein
VEGLEAADPRHGLPDPEVIALNPLLQGLGDVMYRKPNAPRRGALRYTKIKLSA